MKNLLKIIKRNNNKCKKNMIRKTREKELKRKIDGRFIKERLKDKE